MRGKAHSDEVRAQAMAALRAGNGVTEVARQFGLAEGTVGNWKAALSVVELEEVGRQKERDFGEMLGEYLEANLKALKAQAEVASEPDYIRKQPASELAILHGVMSDKSVRLLEAAERARISTSESRRFLANSNGVDH